MASTHHHHTDGEHRHYTLREDEASSFVRLSHPSRAVPMIAFTPNSPQWFAWLASTNILTFQGRHGSFTATCRFRRGKHVQSWTVYRCLHSRSYTLYAGMTMTLTTARLEGLAQQILTHLSLL